MGVYELFQQVTVWSDKDYVFIHLYIFHLPLIPPSAAEKKRRTEDAQQPGPNAPVAPSNGTVSSWFGNHTSCYLTMMFVVLSVQQ
jgi:hypothetical protein